MAWILLGATFVYMTTTDKAPCLSHWRAGWIAMFFAWISFIMYLRRLHRIAHFFCFSCFITLFSGAFFVFFRIDFVGIYVIMFVTVLVSLMKVTSSI